MLLLCSSYLLVLVVLNEKVEKEAGDDEEDPTDMSLL